MKGVDVLESVESFRQQARREEQDVEQQTAQLNAQIEAKMSEKTAAVVELAGHYLPAIDQEAVRRNHKDVRERLTNVLARKARELRRLTDQLSELQPQLDRVDMQGAELSRQLQAARVEHERLLALLDQQIQQDPEIHQLAADLAVARGQLAQNEVRLDEIRREADEKLPAYEASSLFQYLLQRKFGESAYRGRGLPRQLDRWVARLVDFDRAKKGYEFLRVTPELMATEIAKRRKATERLCQKLESKRDAHKKRLGALEIEKQIAKLEDVYKQTLDNAEAMQSEIEPLEEEYERIESSQGRFYDEALDELVEFLSQMKTSVLKQWAEQTTAPEDDEIVAQIQWLAEKTTELKAESRRLQSKRRKLASRNRQLQYVIRSCRRSEIDSARCSYPTDFNVQGLLERYAAERLDQHELLRQLREHREFAPTAAERAAEKVTNVLAHPSVQTIMQVVAAATGEVLRQLLMPRRR